MVPRVRLFVLLLMSGAVAAETDISVPVIPEYASDSQNTRVSSLPDLASDAVEKEEKESKGQSIKEKSADYITNSATQGFENLTPEALESQARSYLQNQITSSAQSFLEGAMSPYGKVRTSLSVGEGGDLEGS